MSLLLALLAQVGPHVSSGARPASPLPPELQNRPAPRAASPQAALAKAAAPQRDRLSDCLAAAGAAPGEALEAAGQWLAQSKGADRSAPGHCLGAAHSQLGHWQDARAAFAAAHDAADPEDHSLRARLNAMAGNAALAAGEAAAGLAAFDTATADALAAGEPMVAGDIAIDRARALVMLKRLPEAEAALAEARVAVPGNAQAWLLAATLSRRLEKLAQAQSQIERAAELLPVDPDIGLEAGVIAAMSGRMESARRSWQSVVSAAPESGAARAARSYLEQTAP